MSSPHEDAPRFRGGPARKSADSREPDEPPIRFTNNRKIDREPTAGGGDITPPPAAADPGTQPAPEAQSSEKEEVHMVEASLLDERTADLQRVQAEYANYRRRADRDRLAAGDAGVAKALAALLPVIDDVQRARAHGDVTGPFEAIVDKLDRQLDTLGLTAFGAEGDPFDPTKHEAVQHDERDDVDVPTCTTIMRKGYIFKDRLLRAAMVGVSDPTHPADTVAAEKVESDAATDRKPENQVRDGDPDTDQPHVED